MHDAAARIAAVSDSPDLDAGLLLTHVLTRPRSYLIAHADDPLTADDDARFRALVERRRAGEPVAYLTGSKGFWSLDLTVSAAVLVPRPETELLVERALAVLPPGADGRIADLGTGSGALALALASERPGMTVIATDASDDALDVARGNARRLGLTNVECRRGEWLTALEADGKYRLIVSNPPYVAAGDPHLVALGHEPQSALVAGPDGLDALRRIVADTPAHLDNGGYLMLEHGADQGPAVRALLHQAGFRDIETHSDLAGHPRVTVGCSS
ncbi:N5-glutamine S-adenosyl-L-methionine-dependent methyltransferase [Salinisphaera sp. PC39]|uniref:peptide chain release factor N(5)-glutamine methyltransferase n=1 Tax=Salinisphaera sp. PC39 TaxID=1304156 RepID=UPI0033409CD1